MDQPQWSDESDSTLGREEYLSRPTAYCEKCGGVPSPGAPILDIDNASPARRPGSISASSWITWDNDQDPENPKNFRCRTKCLIPVLIGMMNFVVSIAISLFSGILEETSKEFSTGKDEVQFALLVYILGLAFGPLLFGPASEYYGRKLPLVGGMMGFIFSTLMVTTSRNLWSLLLCRFLAGAYGSAAYVIPPGIFVDLFGPVGRAIGYMAFATASFAGGSLGPPIGALIVGMGLDWRWTMWLCIFIALPLVVCALLIPETLEAIVLKKKAKRLRFETGDWTIRSRRDEVPVQLSNYLLKPWIMLMREPVLVVITIAFTLDYAIQSLTYSAIPYAFLYRGWSTEASAWALSTTIIGFALGFAIVALDTKLRLGKQLRRGGHVKPESRLPPMIAGMAMLSIGLLWFGQTSNSSYHWVLEEAAQVVFGCGMYLVWVTATVYVQDLYLVHANSALAACSFVRYLIGAAFPRFATPMYEKYGIQWPMSLLGILCAGLVPVHIIFYVYGPKLRSWSKFAGPP